MKKSYSLNRGWGATTSKSGEIEDVHLLSLSEPKDADPHHPNHSQESPLRFERAGREPQDENVPLIADKTCSASVLPVVDDFRGSVDNVWPSDIVNNVKTCDSNVGSVPTNNKDDDSGNSSMSGAGSFDGDSLSGRTRSSSSDSKSEAEVDLTKVFERREKSGDSGKETECDEIFSENVCCDVDPSVMKPVKYLEDIQDDKENEHIIANAIENRSSDTSGTLKPSPVKIGNTIDAQIAAGISMTPEAPNNHSQLSQGGPNPFRAPSPVKTATSDNITLNPKNVNVLWGSHDNHHAPPPPYTTQFLPQSLAVNTNHLISSSGHQDIPLMTNNLSQPHTANSIPPNNNTDIACTSFARTLVPLHYMNSYQQGPLQLPPPMSSPSPPSPSASSSSSTPTQETYTSQNLCSSPAQESSKQQARVQFHPDNLQQVSFNPHHFDTRSPLRTISQNNTPIAYDPWSMSHIQPSLSHPLSPVVDTTNGQLYYFHPNYPNGYIYNPNTANSHPSPYSNRGDETMEFNNDSSSSPPAIPQSLQADMPPEFQRMPDNASFPSTSNELSRKLKELDTRSNALNPQPSPSQNPFVMVSVQRPSESNTTPEGILKHPQQTPEGQFYIHPQSSQHPQQKFTNWTHSNSHSVPVTTPTSQHSNSPPQLESSNGSTPPSSAIPSLAYSPMDHPSSFQLTPFPQVFTQHSSPPFPENFAHLPQNQQPSLTSTDNTRQQTPPMSRHPNPPLPQQPFQFLPSPGMTPFATGPNGQNTHGTSLAVVHENEEMTPPSPSTDEPTPSPEGVSNISEGHLNGDTYVTAVSDVPDGVRDTHTQHDTGVTHPNDTNVTQAEHVTGLTTFVGERVVYNNTLQEPGSSKSISDPLEIVTMNGTSKDSLIPHRSLPDYKLLCLFASIINPIIGPFALLANRTAKQNIRRRDANAANNWYLLAILLSAVAVFTTVTGLSTFIVHLALTSSNSSYSQRPSTPLTSSSIVDISTCNGKLIGSNLHHIREFFGMNEVLYCQVIEFPKMMSALQSFYTTHQLLIYNSKNRNSTVESERIDITAEYKDSVTVTTTTNKSNTIDNSDIGNNGNYNIGNDEKLESTGSVNIGLQSEPTPLTKDANSDDDVKANRGLRKTEEYNRVKKRTSKDVGADGRERSNISTPPPLSPLFTSSPSFSTSPLSQSPSSALKPAQ